MSIVTVGTPFNIDLEFATAPIHRRVVAVFLDMFFIILYMLLIYRFVIIGFDLGAKLSQLTMTICISILPFLYFPLTEILMNGQTPGKRFLGIKVMDLQGKEPTVSQYLLRWLLGLGNYCVFILPYFIQTFFLAAFSMLIFSILVICILYLPAFFASVVTSNNQRIADITAGTVVIDLRKKMSFTETIYQEITGDQIIAKYPQVLKLSDKDINGIKNLLHKKSNKKDDWEYRAMIVGKICAAIGVSSEGMDDTQFLSQLLKDYNYLTQRK